MDHYLPEASRTPDDHWQHYIDTGYGDASRVREVILRSWQRCLASGVDPYNQSLHDHLQGDRLAEALRRRERLISVAYESAHLHILGMVVAAAKAIIAQLRILCFFNCPGCSIIG